MKPIPSPHHTHTHSSILVISPAKFLSHTVTSRSLSKFSSLVPEIVFPGLHLHDNHFLDPLPCSDFKRTARSSQEVSKEPSRCHDTWEDAGNSVTGVSLALGSVTFPAQTAGSTAGHLPSAQHDGWELPACGSALGNAALRLAGEPPASSAGGRVLAAP